MTKIKIYVTITIICFLVTIIPLWYWALFGMSQDVGSAWILTDFIVYSICILVGFNVSGIE
jgi:hypothetical protein